MPKRMFNGDRAWRSNKLKKLPEPLAAEYAWMYSLALADGTFECAPERVYADAYAYVRKNWTPQMVGDVLDQFEEIGLLRRAIDADGVEWGFWTGSESELPSEGEGKKYKRGKKYIFDALKTPEPLASQSGVDSRVDPEPLVHGLDRFGLDRIGMDGFGLKESPARPLGEYRQNEFSYLNRKPEKLYAMFVEKWGEAVGPGAICRKPFKAGWKWFEETCSAVDADTLVPAFELWAYDNARAGNEYPISDFLRSLGVYTQRIAPAKEIPEDDPEIKATIERDLAESQARLKRALERPEPTESFEELLARVEETSTQ